MILLLIAGIILMMQLQKILFRKYWSEGLSVRVRYADPDIREGDRTYLKETIINAKRMPLPALELRLQLDKNLVIEGDEAVNAIKTDRLYERDLFSLVGRQKVIRSIPVVGKKRGHYRIDSVEVVANDFFYLNEENLTLQQDTGIYVCPSAVDTSRISVVMRAISGASAARRRLYPDPFEFSGIREYRPNDPMTQVNWKATARAGELLVNQFDSTTDTTLTVVLDIEDAGIFKETAFVEESIRIASSLSAVLANSGSEFDFVTSGHSEDGALTNSSVAPTSSAPEQASEIEWTDGLMKMHIKPGAGLVGSLNRRLACLSDRSGVISLSDCLEDCLCDRGNAHIGIIISKNVDREYERAAEIASANSIPLIWVVPCMPETDREFPAVKGISFIRWEVV